MFFECRNELKSRIKKDRLKNMRSKTMFDLQKSPHRNSFRRVPFIGCVKILHDGSLYISFPAFADKKCKKFVCRMDQNAIGYDTEKNHEEDRTCIDCCFYGIGDYISGSEKKHQHYAFYKSLRKKKPQLSDRTPPHRSDSVCPCIPDQFKSLCQI